MCNQCIQEVIEKLTLNDIYLLHELQDKTTAQTGETRNEIFENLKDENLKEPISNFQLGQSIMRLELLGFINSMKSGRLTFYNITQSGLVVLETLSNR